MKWQKPQKPVQSFTRDEEYYEFLWILIPFWMYQEYFEYLSSAHKSVQAAPPSQAQRAGSVCVACRKTRTSNNVGNTSSWCFLRVLSCSSPSHSLTFQKFNESRTKLWRVLACFPSLHEVCPSAHRSCSSRWLGTNSRWRNFQREQPRCSANG